MSKKDFTQKITELVEKISKYTEKKYKTNGPAWRFVLKHMCAAIDHLLIVQCYIDNKREQGDAEHE